MTALRNKKQTSIKHSCKLLVLSLALLPVLSSTHCLAGTSRLLAIIPGFLVHNGFRSYLMDIGIGLGMYIN